MADSILIKVIGPAGSGKSTIIEVIENELNRLGVKCEVLDEDYHNYGHRTDLRLRSLQGRKVKVEIQAVQTHA